jgi:hypothetical protein
MRASFVTRAGSLVAAAVIATTGAAAVAGAAGASTAAVRRHPTHLSIGTHRAVVHHKHVTVIAGRLTSGKIALRDRLIFLDRVVGPKHKLVHVRREHTNKNGAVAFVVAPKSATRYVLVFPGTPRFHSSRSAVVTVKG